MTLVQTPVGAVKDRLRINGIITSIVLQAHYT